MKRLQDINIQSKLIGIFAVVFLVGLVAIGWNTFNIDRTRNDVKDVVSTSRAKVTTALDTSKEEVTHAITTSRDQVSTVLDKTDELLYLQILQIEFRELEAIEKDYVLAADPDDAQGLIPAYEQMRGWLQEDLATAFDLATDEHVRGVMTGLQDELQAQADHFGELVTLMQSDPEAARRLSLDGSARKADNIYNVLADLVNLDWDDTVGSVDETRLQMQSMLDESRQEMQGAIDRTSAQLDEAAQHADEQMQRAITVGLVTIGLFVLAGLLVAAAMFIVSRQIVQPVLKMSDVAEGIEREVFKTEELDPIAGRQDEIGKLARVFQRMAKEIYTRVERLKQQVANLQIVIDERKLNQQVSEITDTEYFQSLQASAEKLRARRKRDKPTGDTEGGPGET